MKLSRRHFTKSATAGLMLSPFYNLLQAPKAKAAVTGPRRVLIYHNQPCDTRQWLPTGVSGESTFSLPEMLSNLGPLLPNMVMIDGLSPKQPGDNHFSPHAVTGVGREGRPDKGIISIEQWIGDQLEKTPNKRPIKNLILGASAGSESVFYRNSARLPTIASPMSAYNTVFSGGLPTPDKQPSQLLEQRKSILDTLKGDLGELSTALGAVEKQKLELHLDSIRQFETRLAGAKGGEAACTKPATPTADLGSVSAKTKADLAHLELICNAFACDITRVGAVQFGNSHTWQFDTPTGLRGELHMGIIHVQKISAEIAIQNWLAAEFVKVCNKLKSIPELDGSGTLFDNTLVIWTRDFGDADGHNSKSMKFVVAQGDGGTYLKRNPKGRYLNAQTRQERILLNLAEFMGLNDFTGFGDMSPEFKANKTPLAELRM